MSYIIINVCIRLFSSAQGGVNQCLTTKNRIKLFTLLSACPRPHFHTSSQSSSHLSVSSRVLIDLLVAQAQNERERVQQSYPAAVTPHDSRRLSAY